MLWLAGSLMTFALAALAVGVTPAGRRRLRRIALGLRRALSRLNRWHSRRGSVVRTDLLASTIGMWLDPITVGRAYERLDVGQLLVEGVDPLAVLASRFHSSPDSIAALLSEYLGSPVR
jgi:hypothetical protein